MESIYLKSIALLLDWRNEHRMQLRPMLSRSLPSSLRRLQTLTALHPRIQLLGGTKLLRAESMSATG